MIEQAKTVRGESLWRDGALEDSVFLLDVRTPAEFRETHIEGSTNIPLGNLKSQVPSLRQTAADKRIVVICRTGKRAQAACAELERSDVTNLEVLTGGIADWVDAGHPVARGAKAMSLERQVRIAAGSLVVLGVLLGLSVHIAFVGLSGFVGAGLVFSGVTDTCGMAMLIAKLPWNRAPATCDLALEE